MYEITSGTPMSHMLNTGETSRLAHRCEAPGGHRGEAESLRPSYNGGPLGGAQLARIRSDLCMAGTPDDKPLAPSMNVWAGELACPIRSVYSRTISAPWPPFGAPPTPTRTYVRTRGRAPQAERCCSIARSASRGHKARVARSWAHRCGARSCGRWTRSTAHGRR